MRPTATIAPPTSARHRALGDAPAPYLTTTIDTPLGPMLAATTAQGLCLLEFADRRALHTELADLARRLPSPAGGGSEGSFSGSTGEHLDLITRELAGYFAGTLRAFTVPLHAPGSPFETRVWTELLRIPYGQTRSYGQIARALGQPSATRAVGRANGANRIAIVIPCHRVIESSGALRGYGGGLHRKRFLLDLEARHLGRNTSLFDRA